MKLHVKTTNADGPSQRYTIPKDGRLTFGRGSQADVQIVTRGVSRQHCCIEGDGERFWLVDLDSKHGTFVNDQRISRYLLYDGDVIQIGSKQFEVEIEGEPSDAPVISPPPSPDLSASPAGPAPAARDNPWHQSLSGQIVGSYQLLERLGRNEFVAVYRARHLSVGRPVAFKVLCRSVVEEKGCVQCLLRGSRAAAQLKHKNVVHTYDVGHEDDLAFLVTEFVSGRTLKGVLTSEKRLAKLTPARAGKIAAHMARALRHAHESGVVHGNIIPKYVMLSRDGIAKLADFGLAASLMCFAKKDLSHRAVRMEIVSYLAPEQITSDGLVDERTDIYCLGAILYHMLTTQPPFPNAPESLDRIPNALPTPPSRIVSHVPAPLSDLCMHALSKAPENRPQTANDFLVALRRP
ncbi:MAG TPA: FHA domain-containing protein [Planctomycetaceae bacterium]|nr:FHA domain-containing protein [Planctomycetaceae bacterium]